MQINIFVNGNRDCWVVKWSGKKCILGNLFQVFFCVLFAFLDYEICATDFPFHRHSVIQICSFVKN